MEGAARFLHFTVYLQNLCNSIHFLNHTTHFTLQPNVAQKVANRLHSRQKTLCRVGVAHYRTYIILLDDLQMSVLLFCSQNIPFTKPAF